MKRARSLTTVMLFSVCALAVPRAAFAAAGPVMPVWDWRQGENVGSISNGSCPALSRISDAHFTAPLGSLTPNQLWAIQGDPSNPDTMPMSVYAIDIAGTNGPTCSAKIDITTPSGTAGANHDWEAVAGAGGQLGIYDTGDAGKQNLVSAIYSVPVPTSTTPPYPTSIQATKYRFSYQYGAAHNVTAGFMTDAGTFYLVTNDTAGASLFKLSNPAPAPTINTAMLVTSNISTATSVTSADITNDWIVLKGRNASNAQRVFFYRRTSGQTINQTLQAAPLSKAAQTDPGTSVALQTDRLGYQFLPTSFQVIKWEDQGSIAVGASNTDDFSTSISEPVSFSRIFYPEMPPDVSAVQDALRAGRIPLVSFKSILSGGAHVPWSQVANGSNAAYETALGNLATQIAHLKHTVYMSFFHEPENDPSFGTSTDYKAAWQHVVTVFNQHGTTNVRWVLILMGFHYTPDSVTHKIVADDWNPDYGKAARNQILYAYASDGYNFVGCDTNGGYANPNGTWSSFQNKFKDAIAYAQNWSPARPYIAAEIGSAYDPMHPNLRHDWLAAMQTYVQGASASERIIGLSWYNSDNSSGGGCNYLVQPPDVSAWQAIFTSPAFA